MKIGLFTSGYQRSDLELAFKDAKGFGYDYIELWGGRPHAYPMDFDICVPKIRALIEKYQIPVKIYTPEMNAYPFNMMWEDERMRNESIEYTMRAMDFSKAIGAEFTLVSAGHAGFAAGNREIKDRLYGGLKRLLDYADKIDHKIIYEALSVYESNVTNSSNQMLEILEDLDHPRIFGMNDIVVPFIQGENILSYLDKLGDRMVHMHIVDSDGQSESHVCPGLGVLPLEGLMRELKERGYDRTATIELVTNYLNEPGIYAKMAIDNLRGMMK